MTAIEVDGVTKRYRQYSDRTMFGRLVSVGRRRSRHEVEALRDISFGVERGATLGVIGLNGSGKTTLLRLLSGVSAPTEGRVRLVGRVAPLIGIGVGFNRELSGRENVEVNGRLLGLTREQVLDRFDRIVEFSELEESIDVPVKFYSSGMFLRLAFSVAIHTDPEILLVDEILAVGDARFQTKCAHRIRELQEGGATIVIVTHNLGLLQRLTGRTIVLDRGRMRFDGSTEDALGVYDTVAREAQEVRDRRIGHQDAGQARIRLSLGGADDTTSSRIRAGQNAEIRADIEFMSDVENPFIGLIVEQPGIGMIFAAATEGEGHEVYGPGRPVNAVFRLANVPLMSGNYSARLAVHSSDHSQLLGVSQPLGFVVTNEHPGVGTVDLGASVTLNDTEVPVVRRFLPT